MALCVRVWQELGLSRFVVPWAPHISNRGCRSAHSHLNAKWQSEVEVGCEQKQMWMSCPTS